MIHEKDLVRGLIANDIKSFEKFIDIYSRDILKTVSYVLSSSLEKHYIEECFDDVVMQVWKNSKSFKFQCSFKTWVMCISKNKALDYKRKLKKYYYEVEIDETIKDKNNVEDEYLEKEASREMEYIINKLSENDKKLFVKRYILDIPIKSLCEQYSISENVLYKRLSRMRERMKKILEKRKEKDYVQ